MPTLDRTFTKYLAQPDDFFGRGRIIHCREAGGGAVPEMADAYQLN